MELLGGPAYLRHRIQTAAWTDPPQSYIHGQTSDTNSYPAWTDPPQPYIYGQTSAWNFLEVQHSRDIGYKQLLGLTHLNPTSMRYMETSEALHWTQQQQQKIDLDPELYTPKIENIAVIEISMETSEALHWTQQQQKIDMDPELYTPKIEKIAVIEICTETSEALHWTQQQQKIDMDPELYTPKIENIAVIEMCTRINEVDRIIEVDRIREVGGCRKKECRVEQGRDGLRSRRLISRTVGDHALSTADMLLLLLLSALLLQGKWDPEVKALLMFEALSPEVRLSLEEMGIRNDSSFKSIASKLNILYPKKARGIRECLKLIEGLKQRVGESPMVFKERFLAIRDKVEYSFDDSLVFEIFLENVLDKYREAIVRSEAKSIDKAVSVMATEDSVEHRCSFMKGVYSVEGVEEINSIKSEMNMLSASVNRMKHENEQCIADLRGEVEKLTKLLGEIRLSPPECSLGHIASDCSRQSSMFFNRNTLDNAEIVNIRSYGGNQFRNLPIVKVNINGNMWHLLYDTGSQVSIIDSEKCKVLKENWDDALKTLRIVSVTGQEQTLTRVKTCRVGNENGIELGEIRFWLMSLGDKGYDGILGINDIRRLNIQLPPVRERCNMISLKPEDHDYVDLSCVASEHRPMVSSFIDEKSVRRIENEAVKLPPTEFNRSCECSAGSVNSFRKPTWAERLRVMRKAKETVRQFMSGNSAKKLMNSRPPYSRSFDRGDLVMLAVPKTEGYSNVYGPFRVEARVSDVNFRVRGVTMHDVKVVHVDRMKAFRNRPRESKPSKPNACRDGNLILLMTGGWCQRFVYNYEQPGGAPPPSAQAPPLSSQATPPSSAHQPRVQYAAEQYKEFNREYDFDGDKPPRTRQSFFESPQIPSSPSSSPSFTFDDVYKQFLKNVPAPETNWFNRQPRIVQSLLVVSRFNLRGIPGIMETGVLLGIPILNLYRGKTITRLSKTGRTTRFKTTGNLNKTLGKAINLNKTIGSLNRTIGKTINLNKTIGKTPNPKITLGKIPNLNRTIGRTPNLNKTLGKTTNPKITLGKIPNFNRTIGKTINLNRTIGRTIRFYTIGNHNRIAGSQNRTTNGKLQLHNSREDRTPHYNSSHASTHTYKTMTSHTTPHKPTGTASERSEQIRSLATNGTVPRMLLSSIATLSIGSFHPLTLPLGAASTQPAANLAVGDLPVDEDGDEIPGRAGKDYPTLHVIPKTSFSCTGRAQGYYADTETSCQIAIWWNRNQLFIDLTCYLIFCQPNFLDKSRKAIHKCVSRCWRSSAWSRVYRCDQKYFLIPVASLKTKKWAFKAKKVINKSVSISLSLSLNANTILEPLYEGFYRREIEDAVVFPANREDILEYLSPEQSSALKEFLDKGIAHVGDKDFDLGKMLSDFRAECEIKRDDTQWDSSDTDNVMHLCQYGGVQSSFLCPNGTIFSQDKFSCQWCSAHQPRVQYAAEQYKEFNREYDFDGDKPPRTRQSFFESPQIPSSPSSSPSFTFDDVYKQFLKNVPAPETNWFNRQPRIVQIQPQRNSWDNGNWSPSWNTNSQPVQRQDYNTPQQNWQNNQVQHNWQPQQNTWQSNQPQQNYWQPQQNNWQNNQPQQNNWQNNQHQQDNWQNTQSQQNNWQNNPPQDNTWQNTQPQQNTWQNTQPQQNTWQPEQNSWQPEQNNQWQAPAPQQPRRQNTALQQQPRQHAYIQDDDQPYNAAQVYWDSVREVRTDQKPRDQWNGAQDVRPRPTPAPYQPPPVAPPTQPRRQPARRPASSQRRQPAQSSRQAPPHRPPPVAAAPAHRPPPVASNIPDNRGSSYPLTLPVGAASTQPAANLAVGDLPVDEDGDEIPGRAGKDYPTLHVIPKTSFSCSGRAQGYYADTETSCQVLFFLLNPRSSLNSYKIAKQNEHYNGSNLRQKRHLLLLLLLSCPMKSLRCLHTSLSQQCSLSWMCKAAALGLCQFSVVVVVSNEEPQMFPYISITAMFSILGV
ncbi:hypothetical protein LAZ67_1002973 [Cordylochernes scorpioides]|uniref:Integrase p58-like C-terminal domain-containing protein n=1 Tax=Cordylochernes scorpioides TaxID=51811 RepID=A0ABY6JY45_9ARAC|nr:hypothetical protein LAZ67_1002973 [Cordylochernes scorpioides]